MVREDQTLRAVAHHYHVVHSTIVPASFSSIVEAVRMEMVGRYLDDPNRPLYLIAQLLGFFSLSAFSRWFRDRYGCSPSKWRAQT